MTSQYSRRKMLSLLGGAGLVGGSSLLSSCGGGGGGSGSSTSTNTVVSSNTCTLTGTASPVASGVVENISNDLLNTTLQNQAATYRNVDRLNYPTRVMAKAATASTLTQHPRSLCNLSYTYGGNTYSLSDYFTRNRTAGLMVLKNGQIALEQYAMGNSASSRWTSFSVAKSLTSTLVGVAVNDGAIGLDNTVASYLPSFAGAAYAGNTIRQLLSMTSGIAWTEDAALTSAGTLGALFAAAKTGNSDNVLAVMRNCTRDAAAGSVFKYSTGESYLLGAIVAAATGRKLSTYFSEKIAAPMGMETNGYWILDAVNGLEMGGNNFSATLRDYARFGQFFLKDGTAGYPRVLPVGWRSLASQPGNPATAHGVLPIANYPLGYGYQWWSFPTGANATSQGLEIHDGAFTAQGIYGQFIYINPTENALAVVWSAWPTSWDGAKEFETYNLIAAALTALR